MEWIVSEALCCQVRGCDVVGGGCLGGHTMGHVGSLRAVDDIGPRVCSLEELFPGIPRMLPGLLLAVARGNEGRGLLLGVPLCHAEC